MIVTANKIPVPDPIAPKKSAMTDKPPMHSPPKAAAVGMYLYTIKGNKYVKKKKSSRGIQNKDLNLKTDVWLT